MLLPPEIKQQEDQQGQPQQQIPPAVLQQFMSQNEQLTAALNEAHKLLETKMMELQSRERIESMRIQADLLKTEAQLGAKDSIAQLQLELQHINQWQQRLDAQQASYMQQMQSEAQRAHESQMSAQQAQQQQAAAQQQAALAPPPQQQSSMPEAA
jgi:chromosome segregation ATPase